MKRLMVKFAVLAVLTLTGCFLYLETSVSAVSLSCWEQAYNKWIACDGAYTNTLGIYHDRSNYCDNNSSNICSSTANSYCTAQANTACSGNPNFQQCFNSQYSSCCLAQYQSCHTATTLACLDNVDQAYSNRGNSYASCLGVEGNYGNCIEEVEFSCIDAQSRASACLSIYDDEEDIEAYNTCRANSGVDLCM